MREACREFGYGDGDYMRLLLDIRRHGQAAFRGKFKGCDAPDYCLYLLVSLGWCAFEPIDARTEKVFLSKQLRLRSAFDDPDEGFGFRGQCKAFRKW